MLRTLQRWWLSAVAIAATLTTPKMAPETSDQAFAEVIHDSWLAGMSREVSQAVRAAWQDAVVHSWSGRLSTPWLMASGAQRVRLAAVSSAAAGITALVARAASPAWAAPFTWVLPVAVTLIACVACAAAEPLSRAIAARCS
jgi:hypothetical protein